MLIKIGRTSLIRRGKNRAKTNAPRYILTHNGRLFIGRSLWALIVDYVKYRRPGSRVRKKQ